MNNDKIKTFEDYESNVRSYCRKWPTIMKSAKGSFYIDIEGNKYIDFFNGAGALNYGHNPDYIKEQLIKYLSEDGITHSLDMYTKTKEDFISYFENNMLKPRNLDYKIMFPGPTGTNAIEASLKLARKVTGRNEIWAFMGAFHGMTLGSISLTTESAARKGAGVPLNYVTHIPTPNYIDNFDTIKYMETILNDDHSGIEKPAAIVIETVQAEGGINVFENKFLQDLRNLCNKYEILLIVDDVQVGCSRTGTFFSFERAGIVPDIVCMSKSIGGYGLPFALVLLKPELDKFNPGEHNGTFRGCQLSILAAKCGLEININEKVDDQVKYKEKIVKDYLDKEIKPLLSEGESYRGIGMIWGIQFKNGKDSRAVLDRCFKKGLIIELAGRDDSVLKILPSLVIDEETLLKGLDIIKECIKEYKNL